MVAISPISNQSYSGFLDCRVRMGYVPKGQQYQHLNDSIAGPETTYDVAQSEYRYAHSSGVCCVYPSVGSRITDSCRRYQSEAARVALRKLYLDFTF